MELRMNCFQAQHLREQVTLHESLEAVRSAPARTLMPTSPSWSGWARLSATASKWGSPRWAA